ncbi:class I SAM-dependent methyltransferase [Delftia acidovorans]|uniref:class I SAM-dependent methyltransferase n=1 Tax=Delftia acidovorans TaxID=80866 RepID=UPI00242DE8D4|nr:class I SAM-dependent methyltransferase [Delftia acidovorans]
MMRRLPWPAPALLAWAGAWLFYAALQSTLGPLAAWLAACFLGVLASLLATPWWRRLAVAAGFPLSCLMLWGPGGLAAISPWLWLAALGLLTLVYPLNAWRDAPLFPTPTDALQGLADAAPLPDGAAVLDAGCGLGDGLRALRGQYPQARLNGMEWSWPLRWLCALRCPWARVRRADIWLADWSSYQMVYLFQRPESMGRAAVKAATELPEGAWLVSLDFALPGVEPSWQRQGPGRHSLWVYRMPLGGAGEAVVHVPEPEETPYEKALRELQERR